MSANEWVRKLEAYNIAQRVEPDPGEVRANEEMLQRAREEQELLNNKDYQKVTDPKPKTQGEQLRESGQYLRTPETEDTSKPVNYWEGNETGWPDDEVIDLIDGLLGDYNKGPQGNPLGPDVYAPQGGDDLVPDSGRWPRNVPLQSSPSFDIDPNKKPLTERQKGTQDKLRKRAGSGQQGARTAKEILEKKGGSALDLPTFLQGVIEKIPEAAALGGAFILQLFGPRGMFQLSELNPAQLEVLKKGIPLNLPNLPPDVRVDTMKRLTGELKKHGSIPTV